MFKLYTLGHILQNRMVLKYYDKLHGLLCILTYMNLVWHTVLTEVKPKALRNFLRHSPWKASNSLDLVNVKQCSGNSEHSYFTIPISCCC